MRGIKIYMEGGGSGRQRIWPGSVRMAALPDDEAVGEWIREHRAKPDVAMWEGAVIVR